MVASGVTWENIFDSRYGIDSRFAIGSLPRLDPAFGSRANSCRRGVRPFVKRAKCVAARGLAPIFHVVASAWAW